MSVRKIKKYSGVTVPVATPFKQDGTVDIDATVRQNKYLADNGMTPFLLGTTGESTSVPIKERLKMVKAVIEAVGDNATVYAGAAGTSLGDVSDLAWQYYENGIKVFVMHLPYYYPLSDAQMLKFFSDVADKVPAPIILYNMPATTHMSIPLPILEELSKHENIIGVKDSERDAERQIASIKMWKDREDFSFLWGGVL